MWVKSLLLYYSPWSESSILEASCKALRDSPRSSTRRYYLPLYWTPCVSLNSARHAPSAWWHTSLKSPPPLTINSFVTFSRSISWLLFHSCNHGPPTGHAPALFPVLFLPIALLTCCIIYFSILFVSCIGISMWTPRGQNFQSALFSAVLCIWNSVWHTVSVQ